jgi:hypothetical protein
MDRRLALNGHTRKLHRSLPRDWAADWRHARWTRGLGVVAPIPKVGFRAWFSAMVDRLILAMAVAGAEDDPASLHPEYAESMVLVFGEYFRVVDRRRNDLR